MERPLLASNVMRQKETCATIMKWWEALKKNRGARAKLRRCREPSQVLLHSIFYELPEALPGWPPGQTMALAAIAGLLSHVDTHNSNSSFASQLGNPKPKGGKAPMSENRFRQLIKSREWEEYYFRTRRAILLLKPLAANILSIADYTLQFGFEQKGSGPNDPSKGFQFRMANEYFTSALETAKQRNRKEAPK